MYLSNYHSHSIFCDGRSHPEVFVQYAISKGLKAYGFSSHAPLPFLTNWTMKKDDVEEYFQEINRLKEKYKDQIEVYAGLETDYLSPEFNAKSDYFQALPADYLISSIHYISHPISNKLLAIDGSFKEFTQGVKTHFGGDIKGVIERFFELSTQMIELGGFHIIGHVDKIYLNASRFAGFESNQKLVDNLMDDLLITIAKSGLILEINTKSVESKGITYPMQHYFERIYELSIPITINCDTHNPDNVIQGKRETAELLYKIGFRHTMELISGKWQRYKLLN
ncbi:MAG: histidinol-phosphatase [Bacteroidales bacterium]